MDNKLQSIAEEFFSHLTIDIQEISLSEEQEGIYLLKIESNDSSLLIGPHGRNLESLQTLLRALFTKHLDKKVILHLEVNDYLKAKEDKLFRFIESKVEMVRKDKKDIRLPFLNAYERKKVHAYVGGLGDDVYTKSMGDGAERRLYICRSEEKLTIDIDGDDI